MPSAMMTVASDGPSAATSAMASRISGKAIIASMMRAIGASRLRKKPGDEAERDAERPRRTTTTADADEKRQPAGIDACGVKTSRPNSSVPNQNIALGGFRRLTIESRFGA